MRKFTIALILWLASVSCQLSAATVADVKQASCDVYLASNTHPYRVDVIAPQVGGGKAIQP
jgi:predicted HAD superfamily phosphohydrolase YqeG